MRALSVLLALVTLPSLARADVVHTLPCPFGARERTSHAGPRCHPWRCETDADCEGGLVCQPWRVCVQAHDVPIAGRGAWRDPPPPPTREELVLTSCAPTESCTGSETPRAPTRGEPVGEVRCEVAPHCVRPSMPPIPSAPPPPPAPTESAPPAQRAPSAQSVGGSACGCRVGASRSGLPSLAVLALALLFAARRAARRRRRAPGALALCAVLGAALTARAQDAQLPPGWERTQIQPAPLFQSVALACDRERAYVRDWQGEVRAFDGRRGWAPLPRAPARGGQLWASASGRLVVDGERAAYAWDGASWRELAIDPWFHHRQRGDGGVFAIDGLGDSPWILGRGAVGFDVPGDEGVALRAHDVASAWYALTDLEVLAHDRVYVASEAGLLRWDGRAWAREPTGIEGAVRGVHAFAPDDVWAWADTGVARFDGRGWARMDEGVELPQPRGWRGATSTQVHVGGRPGHVYLTTGERVYRLDGSRFVPELDVGHRHPIGRAYGEVCGTERFVVVLEGGFALVRR